MRKTLKTLDQLKQELDQLYNSKKSFALLKSFLTSQEVPYISSGSSRWVFGPVEGKVLKIAKNRKGLSQNYAEADWVYNKYDVICKWFDVSKNDIWIESEYCKKAKPTDFKRLLGYTFKFYQNCLMYIAHENNPTFLRGLDKPDGYDELLDDEDTFLYQMYCLIIDFNLPVGDFRRISSYGLTFQEKLVVVDCGLNPTVWEEHYS